MFHVCPFFSWRQSHFAALLSPGVGEPPRSLPWFFHCWPIAVRASWSSKFSICAEFVGLNWIELDWIGGFSIFFLCRCWYYQHVVSHHVSTNQDNDAEKDVDVVPWPSTSETAWGTSPGLWPRQSWNKKEVEKVREKRVFLKVSPQGRFLLVSCRSSFGMHSRPRSTFGSLTSFLVGWRPASK